MSKIRDLVNELRVVPVAGAAILVGTVIYLVNSYPDTALQDGITFEEDGTALAGRESGAEGWLDLQCSANGEVVVRVVNASGWQVTQVESFEHSSCSDDGDLKPGELKITDIPEGLRG
jgi:hypothetical protein